MARFLSPAWAAAVNAALDGVALPAPGPEAGLAAQDGRFAVAQEVAGTPDGDVRLVLTADAGTGQRLRRGIGAAVAATISGRRCRHRSRSTGHHRRAHSTGDTPAQERPSGEQHTAAHQQVTPWE